MTDFIIVGRGLAATCLMHSFYQHRVLFTTIGDENLSHCSKVAAGIWNPVVFKRMTKSWLADALLPYLDTFYRDCEKLLQKKLITQRPIIKPFTEDHEKVLWLKKAKSGLEDFLDENLYSRVRPELEQFQIPNGYGLVKQSGNLKVVEFLSASSDFFREQIKVERFDHSLLEVFPDKVRYKDLEARHIIFCEGFLVKENPLFSWIPLKPAKGEILTIEAPALHLKNAIFNRDGFLMDVSENTYKAGATYAWDDLSQKPTDKGLEELNTKMRHMVRCEYSVIKQEAGIRPSSLDRRPLIGAHPLHNNVFVFNGLGTKGVMLAPYFAGNFVNFYLQNQALDPEVNINRFYHLYDKKNQA